MHVWVWVYVCVCVGDTLILDDTETASQCPFILSPMREQGGTCNKKTPNISATFMEEAWVSYPAIFLTAACRTLTVHWIKKVKL